MSLLHRLRTRLEVFRHARILRRDLRAGDDAHGRYLLGQMRESVGKMGYQPVSRIDRLVEALVAQGRPTPAIRVLGIGCRNGLELDALRRAGFVDVQGIDLVSTRPDIRVMDMHRLDFPDASFDVVFSSHSFEHAADPDRVAAEFLRVARPGALVVIEVPVGFTPNERDPNDFGSSAGVVARFSAGRPRVLHTEDLPAGHARNNEGTAVARVVFRVH